MLILYYFIVITIKGVIMIDLNEINSLLSLSSLPSKMRVQSSIGDATAVIAEQVSNTVKLQAPYQIEAERLKSYEQRSALNSRLLNEFKEECALFGETPDRNGFELFKKARGL